MGYIRQSPQSVRVAVAVIHVMCLDKCLVFCICHLEAFHCPKTPFSPHLFILLSLFQCPELPANKDLFSVSIVLPSLECSIVGVRLCALLRSPCMFLDSGLSP